jgi:hypothetical protein
MGLGFGVDRVKEEERGTDWVGAVLAEYEAHRSEVLSEAEAQQQILALGATAVGLVVAGAFNVWNNQLLASIAFLGIVPLLCLFVLVQWVGRAAGLMRVGLYLEQLEDALRSAYRSAPPNVFTWEKMLAGTTRSSHRLSANYEWHDFGAIAIFALLAYGSIGLGAYRAYDQHVATAIALLALETVVLSAVAARFLLEIVTARDRVRKSFDSDRSTASETQ